jgi:nucleoid DNA-binding protein
MSKQDVIGAVAAKTGQSPAQCEAILKAFEAICGDTLTHKFKGARHGHANVIAELASKTGQSEQICQAIMKAFEDVLDEALSAKLGFLRKRVS